MKFGPYLKDVNIGKYRARIYDGEDVKAIAHGVKSGNDLITKNVSINKIADHILSQNIIDKNSTIVPAPQHEGKVDYTLKIANLIKAKTGCKIADVLEVEPREELYTIKKNNIKNGNEQKSVDTGVFLTKDVPVSDDIYLLDNVIATGSTYKDVKKLIPNIKPLPYAMSVRARSVDTDAGIDIVYESKCPNKLQLLTEATIDELVGNATSNFTQKHLDIRYNEGDYTIDLAKFTIHPFRNFAEAIFYVNSTFGAQDYIASTDTGVAGKLEAYTIIIRWYKINKFADISDLELKDYSIVENELKKIVHNCDAKFYSDDPSFLFQGCWEDLAKEKMSIFKFPGPKGTGHWHDIHNASGGLTNPNIHLTKHLTQVIREIDLYITDMAQKLEVE